MTIKIGNVSKWSRLPIASALELSGETPRKVRLELNTTMPTHVVAIDNKDQERFLAMVNGLETLEFITDGPVAIACTTEGEVWYFTQDGDNDAIELPLEVPFTKIAQRRHRNPELELLMYKQQQNIERRLAQQQNEFEERLAALGTPYDQNTGEVDEDVTVAKSDGLPGSTKAEAAQSAASGSEGEGSESSTPPAPAKSAGK